MKMDTTCYPCLVRNALDVARLATNDENAQRIILQKAMAFMAKVDPLDPPPLVASQIQSIVTQVTGVIDPYARLKEKYNNIALSLYPDLVRLKKKADPGRRFELGVRMAIAGNIIDFGISSKVGKDKLLSTIDHALNTLVRGSVRAFKNAVDKADHILWLGDNAGEIVFDKLLLEEMDMSKVTFAVRGGPVQNDAVMEDAKVAGLTDMVHVIDSGSVVPGTLIDRCSASFQDIYNRADMIIAKGQGNFETLNHEDSRIFFLFKAKCPVVVRHADCELGDVVIWNCS
ncbi:MAG: ARMT1-like domain-containing protein [Desulfobacterales bacterium]|nr:ARMT1-like domain-containing protein [Desulfobacterales bacterium]